MKKRIVSLALALMMCFSLSVTAFAVETNRLTDQEFVASKISELIPAFLTATEFGVTEENYENLYVGNPITAYTYKNGENTGSYLQYPIVFENLNAKEIVGLARVIEHENGERTIDYGVNCAPQIQVYLETNENTSFALLYSENGVSIATASSQTMIKGYETTSAARMNTISLEEADYALTDIEAIEKIEVPTATFATRTVEHNSLNVEYVDQDGRPLCWAASISCIVEYHTGTSWSIDQIAQMAVDAGYNAVTDDGVNITQARHILNLFGGTNTLVNSYLTYNTLKSKIDLNCPLYIRGYCTDHLTEGHASVAYGYYYGGSGSKYIYYMEPNTGFKTASFPSSGGPLIFTISPNSCTFANNAYIVCAE